MGWVYLCVLAIKIRDFHSHMGTEQQTATFA